MKKIIIFYKSVLFLLIMAVFISGCNKQPFDENAAKQNLCIFLNVDNINQTIPIVNEFLRNLSSKLSEEQQLQKLEEWLQSCTCILGAAVLIQSGNETPPVSEIAFSFDENKTTKYFIMDISMKNPLKTTGYRIFDPKEKICSYLNVQNIDKTIPIVNVIMSGLSDNLEEYQQLEEMTAYFETIPCINSAYNLDFQSLYPIGEISIFFDEKGVTKNFNMLISQSRPLKIFGYYEVNSDDAYQILFIQLQEITENSLIYVVYTKYPGLMFEYDIEYEEVENHMIKVDVFQSLFETTCFCMSLNKVSIEKGTYHKAIISTKTRWMKGGSFEDPEFSDYSLIDSKIIDLPNTKK